MSTFTATRAYPKYSQCTVLAGKDGEELLVLGGREAEEVIDLVRAEVVVGVPAVHVVIVYVTATHHQLATLHPPVCVGCVCVKHTQIMHYYSK